MRLFFIGEIVSVKKLYFHHDLIACIRIFQSDQRRELEHSLPKIDQYGNFNEGNFYQGRISQMGD